MRSMFVGPAQNRLQRRVQIGDGRVAADRDAPPDQETDVTEDDAELTHTGFRACRQAKHPAIVQPHRLTHTHPRALFPTLPVLWTHSRLQAKTSRTPLASRELQDHLVAVAA